MKIKNKIFFALISATVFTSFGSAYAQSPVPSAQLEQAAPGRIEKNLQQRQPEFQSVVTDDRQADIPQIKAPAGAENIRFVLKNLKIKGLTAYPISQLDPLWADAIDEEISLVKIFEIAQALTNRYRNDGYILSRVIVPPQEIDGGEVTLVAVEGFIDRANIRYEDGSPATPDLKGIEDIVKPIIGRIPLKNQQLERILLLINDLPGISARNVLVPSKDTPGAASLEILVTRDPFEGFLSADNFGSRFLGPLQLGGAATFHSLFGLNEAVSLQTVYAPDENFSSELLFLSLGWRQPVGRHGTYVGFNTNYARTKPGFTLDDPFDVEGISQYAAVNISHPLIRNRQTTLRVRTQFDARNVKSSNAFEDVREDDIRSLRIGVNLEKADRFLGGGVSALDAEFSHGLPVLGNTTASDQNVSRPGADITYAKINVTAQRLQSIRPRLNLLAAAQGQLSNNALFSAEEFGVGGAEFGRGYDPSEITGEDGYAAKLELQWTPDTGLPLQLFSFYDVGQVWNDDFTSAAFKRQSLASTGIGLRGRMNDVSFNGFLAFPLTRRVSTEDSNEARAFFSISKRF